MKTNSIPPDYKGFRFPHKIISHALWLYFRFSFSFRDVEELLAQCGIVVSCETVWQWCLKFGRTYANEPRRRRPRCGDTWHMDARLPHNQGQEAFLESGRSGWQRAGYLGAETTEQKGGETILLQAAQGGAICPTRHHH